ncbi:MAG TPA: hypothetical protein VNV37_02085, partial [Solirubrobacteraceae bacterium]|nr:hypothetical protein [Solirubrobacteraceae bacterium]
MNRILQASRPGQWAIMIAVAAAAAVLIVGTASAGASSEIEGVWSFTGGKVDIVPIPGGKFEGIVVSPTKFAECEHLVGEHMWTDITPQPDGSFWGLHQWFHGAPKCERNPDLGPTAWRVLREANGSRYLRVCFSEPGSTSQPTIAANGAPKEASEDAAHQVNYGCDNSELIASLPVTSSSSSSGSVSTPVERLTLPAAKQCLRPGRFTIRLREPKYDPFKTVTILYGG